MVPAEKETEPTLEKVQELFAAWRNQKGRRDPIPPALWESAIHLVEQYSVNAIAKHLRLNYNELKIRAGSYPVTSAPKKHPIFLLSSIDFNKELPAIVSSTCQRPMISVRTSFHRFFNVSLWSASLSPQGESAPQRYQYPACTKATEHPLSRLQDSGERAQIVSNEVMCLNELPRALSPKN